MSPSIPLPPPRSPPRPNQSSAVKVAVIGSGLAGLTTAYLLARDPRIHVQVFEVAWSPALDSASITLKDERDDCLHRVDLPMRSFAGGYYENLRKLYDLLGVRYREQRFLFSFASVGDGSGRGSGSGSSDEEGREGRSISTGEKLGHGSDSMYTLSKNGAKEGEIYFHHPSNLTHLPPRPTTTTSPVHHAVRCVYLLLCYLWFIVCVFLVPPQESDDLGTYLRRTRIPKVFCDSYLFPLLSAVSTCSHQTLSVAPATDVVGYKRLTHRKPHLSVLGGVSEAQDALLAACEGTGRVGFSFGRRVCEVKPSKDGKGVEVRWTVTHDLAEGDGEGKEESLNSMSFDKVVLATPPDVVGKVYPALKREMSDIPTARVTSLVLQLRGTTRFSVVDKELVAGNSHWAAAQKEKTRPLGCNGRGLEEEQITLRTDFRSGRTEAAHRVPCGATVVTCPVSNPEEGSTEEMGLLHRVEFTRVLRTVGSRRVVNRLFETRRSGAEGGLEEKDEGQDIKGGDEEDSIREGLMSVYEGKDRDFWQNGDDGVYLVGGWCWDGMVLLEGCVVSAMRVARDFGVDLPW